MTPENFCYWLQGALELGGDQVTLGCNQVQIIQDHLDLVFNKVTPDRDSADVNNYKLDTVLDKFKITTKPFEFPKQFDYRNPPLITC